MLQKKYLAVIKIYYKDKHNNSKRHPEFEIECHKPETVIGFIVDINHSKFVKLGPLVVQADLIHHCEVEDNE